MSGTGEVDAAGEVTAAASAEVQGEASVQADSNVSGGPEVSDQKFLAAYPEFNDASKYPFPQRQLYMNVALNSMDGGRWGQFYELGVYLWTAHYLTVFGNRRGRPGLPGQIPYPTSNKSVGAVSVGYDTSILARMAESGAGFWALSIYGWEWYRISQMGGTGGVQIGYGPIPPFSGPGFQGIDIGTA